MRVQHKYIAGPIDDRTVHLLTQERPSVFVTLSNRWKNYLLLNNEKQESLIELVQHTKIVFFDLIDRQRPLQHNHDVVSMIDTLLDQSELKNKSLLIF